MTALTCADIMNSGIFQINISRPVIAGNLNDDHQRSVPGESDDLEYSAVPVMICNPVSE